MRISKATACSFLLAVLSLPLYHLRQLRLIMLTQLSRPMEWGIPFQGACVPHGMVQLSPDTDTIPHNVNGTYQPRAYTCTVPAISIKTVR